MIIYKTRYQADKERKNSLYHNSNEIITKVEGGYVLMDADQYRIWKNQK